MKQYVMELANDVKESYEFAKPLYRNRIEVGVDKVVNAYQKDMITSIEAANIILNTPHEVISNINKILQKI